MWDRLLDEAGLAGIYTSLGNYADDDMGKLVTAASAALGIPADGVVRWFGREALPILAKHYPEFFAGHRDTRSFLLTLNDVIHPEVRKLYPGAEAPAFDFSAGPDGAMLMGYTSTRHLCAFGEGLIEGSAVYYGETIQLDQPQCTKRGDARCVFRVSFPRESVR
jgi:hypothetical protein